MKKFIIFILVLFLLAVPVAADSWNSDFSQYSLNVLDFDFPNTSIDQNVIVSDGSTVSFDIPGRYSFQYFDILIQFAGGSTSSFLGASLNGNNLTVIDYGNRLVRLYGLFDRKSYDTLDLTFHVSSQLTLTFLKFDCFAAVQSPVGIPGEFTWERFTSTTEQGTRKQESFRDSVSIVKTEFFDPIYDSTTIPWKVFLSTEHWKQFDFLTFFCSTDLKIDSISASGDFGSLPFTSSIVSLGNDGDGLASKLIVVTVDISSYIRSSSAVPTLTITGSQLASMPGNFTLNEVTGSFKFEYPDPNLTLLQKIYAAITSGFSSLFTPIKELRDYMPIWLTEVIDYMNIGFTNVQSWISTQTTSIVNSLTTLRTNLGGKLDNILSAIKADSSFNNQAADEFNNSVETQAAELQGMSDVMNSVERPDISDVKLDVSDLVDPNQFTLSTVGFSSLLGMDIFTRIIIMALTFALIGFVLFGKR